MLAVGTVLNGKYRIERHLSSGGFGNTYIATNLTFNDMVAVKEFFMRGISQRDGDSSTISVSNPENRALFTEQLEKFKKEAQRIRLLRSPHIVRVHDLFEANGTAYYVMDYIDGGSLGERLKQTNTPLTEKETRKYLDQVIDALEAIHGVGLCHMDLKPENIMVDKDDNAVLIDFGASKRSDNERFTSTVSGVSYTNGYAPPEQLEQDTAHFGPWTDIYALGATLYKLLTNRKPPMPSAFYSDISPDKHNVLPFPEGVSRQLQQIIIQMMSVRWEDRPQSIAALRTMLTRFPDLGTSTNRVSEKQSAETRFKGTPSANNSYTIKEGTPLSRKWLFGIIGGLLFALVVIGVIILRSNQKQEVEEQLVEYDIKPQEDEALEQFHDSLEQERQEPIDRAEMAKDYRVINIGGEKKLGALVNGKLVKTDILSDEVLDEHDYDGNGINDCLICVRTRPETFAIVYYDEVFERFKEAQIDCGWAYDNVQCEEIKGKWFITVTKGIKKEYYQFNGSEVFIAETKTKRESSVKAYFSHMDVFQNDCSESWETREIPFDIDGDGINETFVFESDSSSPFQYGTAMELTIHWYDGKEARISHISEDYSILSSKTHGLYDILVGEAFIYKWNGQEYVCQ